MSDLYTKDRARALNELAVVMRVAKRSKWRSSNARNTTVALIGKVINALHTHRMNPWLALGWVITLSFDVSVWCTSTRGIRFTPRRASAMRTLWSRIPGRNPEAGTLSFDPDRGAFDVFHMRAPHVESRVERDIGYGKAMKRFGAQNVTTWMLDALGLPFNDDDAVTTVDAELDVRRARWNASLAKAGAA